jgi:hypothetical protein
MNSTLNNTVNTTLKIRNWRMVAILLIGDLLALALFIFIGEVQHGLLEAYNPLWRTLQQTAVLAIPWAVLAWRLGAYSPETVVDWRSAGLFFLRSAVVWLYAVPLGLVMRAWVYGAATVLLVFVNAALGFGALFVLGWRILFVWGWVLRKK